MRRITTWIAATLAVVALAAGYQASQSGDDAKGAAPAGHTGKPGESK